ncbi:MgtC/SapB family protein [Clostridium nigeriense]|uniref:MgtC/SapB family protein n=1 Tax=Clostridium nigeriense TaxID=1805470 RepID=UPI0008310855|nr:MgtC/SapB family protein [Clostridium nigeriense]
MNLTVKEIILRIVLALIIGGIIGYERELQNRAAGFRTHILVCLGATIVSLLQIDIGNKAMEIIEVNKSLSDVIKIDYGRLGAQVITGVGFIGAGAIIHTKGNIKGLTTAATLWIVACLGLTIGMGGYLISIFSTILIFITLVFLKRIEDKFISRNTIMVLEVRYLENENMNYEIDNLLEKKKIRIKRIEYYHQGNGSKEIYSKYIICKPRYVHLDEIIKELKDKNYIISINIIS